MRMSLETVRLSKLGVPWVSRSEELLRVECKKPRRQPGLLISQGARWLQGLRAYSPYGLCLDQNMLAALGVSHRRAREPVAYKHQVFGYPGQQPIGVGSRKLLVCRGTYALNGNRPSSHVPPFYSVRRPVILIGLHYFCI